MRVCSSFYLVFPVVVILDEVQNEVEDLFRTEVLDVSEQRHGDRHRLSQEAETTQVEAKAHREGWCFHGRDRHLLQKVALEVDEVVALHDVGAALAAEHPREQGLHGRRTLPGAHHGVGYLQGQRANSR